MKMTPTYATIATRHSTAFTYLPHLLPETLNLFWRMEIVLNLGERPISTVKRKYTVFAYLPCQFTVTIEFFLRIVCHSSIYY
jgi:hypothetical protein